MTKQALQYRKDLKVLIAVPSMGVWREEFGTSMGRMLTYFVTHRVGQYRSQLAQPMSMKGSILPNLRVGALIAAKEGNFDYLLWIDSDQSFPKDTLNRLVLRNLDVVGANVATKTMPTLPTARRKPMEGEEAFGSLIWTDSDSKGVQEVWRLGCGIMLMSRKVIQALPLDCFEMRFRPDVQRYQGEDWTMCENIERLGFKIFIDHDLSQAVGHHGSFNFTHEYNGEVVQNGYDQSQGQDEESGGDLRLRAVDGLRAEPLPGLEGQGCEPAQGAEGGGEGTDHGRGDGDGPLAEGAAGLRGLEQDGQDRVDRP